jgi:hypothetical protein
MRLRQLMTDWVLLFFSECNVEWERVGSLLLLLMVIISRSHPWIFTMTERSLISGLKKSRSSAYPSRKLNVVEFILESEVS